MRLLSQVSLVGQVVTLLLGAVFEFEDLAALSLPRP